MFEANKIYYFSNGWHAIIEKRTYYGWNFSMKDDQKKFIFDAEFSSEDQILNELVRLEKEFLPDVIENINRFGFHLCMPSDEIIRESIVANLKDYDFMEYMANE